MENHIEEVHSRILRGYLVIHVAGYKMVMDHMMHIVSTGSEQFVVPDRLLKAELHPVGSMYWYEEGWAVGDNPRERFCKWDWVKPMLKFRDFDEAANYIYRLRQKRKRANEEYRLVYFLKGVNGKDTCSPVSSLEDIAAFEDQVSAEVEQHRNEHEIGKQKFLNEYPELERLTEAFGRRKAVQLSTLLKAIRENGKEKVKQQTPASSFYRNVQDLKKVGLLD